MAEEFRQRGNELLSQGDLAGAVEQYGQGLVLASESEAASLHGNLSLAHLRRGDAASAVDHATEALRWERGRGRVKLLYRRGLARLERRELRLSQEDFEEALLWEPQNAELRQQLSKIKRLQSSKGETFSASKIFSKQLYEEAEEAEEAVLGEVSSKRVLISVKSLRFGYEKSPEKSVLRGIDLDFHEATCLGLVGLNASGKTTLARLLIGKLRGQGQVSQVHSEVTPKEMATETKESQKMSKLSQRIQRPELLGVAVLVLLAALQWWKLLGIAVVSSTLLLAWWSQPQPSSQKHLVLHLSSETSDKEDIKGSRSIESVIGDELQHLQPTERREKVILMLQVAGFQMYNQETGEPVGSPSEYVRDGLTFGKLSGGQKHLIYILKYFAKCLAFLEKASAASASAAASAQVLLICDEVLGGIDSIRQPRVLKMLKQLQLEKQISILFISTELNQIYLMAEDVAFLHEGGICELGPKSLLEFPKHSATKSYVQEFRSLFGGQHLGGKLAESYFKLEAESWL